MQAFTTQGLSARPVTPGLYNRNFLRNRRTARTVVARAAQGDAQESREEKVVSKVVVSAISAFAAASLALTGSVSATGIVPRNAAPDLSIAKDDDLLGKAFQKAGVPGNGDKAADALRDKTPGVDAKSSAGQAKGAVSDALRKAQNAAPDLSAGKDDDLLGKAFQKAGVPGDANKAADSLRDKTPGVGDDAKSSVQGAAGDAARKAQNAAPDLSAGKDDDLLGKAFQKAGVPGDANKAADSLRDKTPGVGDDAKSSVQGAAGDAARKAQNAAPDLSAGKDDDLLGKAFQKAGVPGNADKAADSLRSKTPGVGSGGGQAKGAVDDAARKVSQKVGGR